MPATIPPIAPGLRASEVTTMDCGGAVVISGVISETTSEVGEAPGVEDNAVVAVALMFLEVVVTRVDMEVTGIDVAAAAVVVTTDGDGCALTDVMTGGAFRNVVGRMTTSPSLGRYGSHSQGMSSQPDLPACRQDSSQSLRNAMAISCCDCRVD